jgi:ribonuclease T2
LLVRVCFFAVLIVLAVSAWPFAVRAQYSGCILDNCADKKPLPAPPAASAPAPGEKGDQKGGVSPEGSGSSGAWVPNAGPSTPQWSAPQPSGASQPGDFDFYVFSLSWSPGFCDTGGAGKAKDQCRDGANLGFVVHGLWPQYNQGFPSDCPGVSSPSWIALQSIQGLYPDIGLARYEWRKHGTCSGKSPTAYFADVRRAHDLIAIPSTFQNAQSELDTSPLDIQRAFIAANPRLRPGMMSVECVDGELSEVRICLSKDVRNFVPCPEVVRHGCRSQSIAISPMR